MNQKAEAIRIRYLYRDLVLKKRIKLNLKNIELFKIDCLKVTLIDLW